MCVLIIVFSFGNDGRVVHFSRAQYGQDTGNPAATFHEVRVWKEQYEPEGKPLIPLRMVRLYVPCAVS